MCDRVSRSIPSPESRIVSSVPRRDPADLVQFDHGQRRFFDDDLKMCGHAPHIFSPFTDMVLQRFLRQAAVDRFEREGGHGGQRCGERLFLGRPGSGRTDVFHAQDADHKAVPADRSIQHGRDAQWVQICFEQVVQAGRLRFQLLLAELFDFLPPFLVGDVIRQTQEITRHTALIIEWKLSGTEPPQALILCRDGLGRDVQQGMTRKDLAIGSGEKFSLLAGKHIEIGFSDQGIARQSAGGSASTHLRCVSSRSRSRRRSRCRTALPNCGRLGPLSSPRGDFRPSGSSGIPSGAPLPAVGGSRRSAVPIRRDHPRARPW